MSAKVLEVPVGQEAKLSIRVSKVPNGTAATFTVFKVSDDSQIGGPIQGTVERGVAETIWTAEGPDPEGEASQRSLRVYFKCQPEGSDAQAVSSQMVVYLDAVELETVDEDGAAMTDVPYEAQVGKKKLPAGDTGSRGVVRIENVPPGELKLKFPSPMRFVEFVEEKAGKLKAKLKLPAKAMIEWPRDCCETDKVHATEGKAKKQRVHRQYTNLPTTADNPNFGHRIRLKVRFDPRPADLSARVGKKGQELFVKLEYPPDAQLSARKVTPRRGFLAGDAAQAQKALTADGGEATFDIELGQAGGDWVLVKVGATDACEDDQVKIVNWRRVYYQLSHPAHVTPFDRERAEAQLGDVFVEFVQDGAAKTFDKATLAAAGADYARSWIPRALLADIAPETPVPAAGKKKKKDEHVGGSTGGDVFVMGNHNFAFFGRPDWFQDGGKPKVSLVAGDVLFHASQLGPGALQTPPPPYTDIWRDILTESSKIIRLEPQLRVFDPELRSGQPAFVEAGWRSAAPEGHPDHGKQGSLDRSCFDITNGHYIILVTLPDAVGELAGPGPTGRASPTDPSVRHPIFIAIALRLASGPWGGWALGKHTWCVNSDYVEFNQVVVHELGHAMFQVARPTGRTAPPPNLDIAQHGFDYEGQGHVGPHCRWKLDQGATHVERQQADGSWRVSSLGGQKASDQPDYNLLRKRLPNGEYVQAGGMCTMYGTLWRTRKAGKMVAYPRDGFCEKCQPFLKGVALETLGEAPSVES